jgi:multiple sugar transport system substrate-binding protein
MRHTYATGFVVSTIGVDPINTFNAFTVAYGGQDMVTKDGKYHGNDPQVREALLKMLVTLSKLYKEGFIPPSSINWNDADDNNAFHSKLVVMDYDGSLSTELPHMKNKQVYEHELITGRLPLSNDGKQLPVQAGVFGPVIAKGAKNVTVAKEFLKYAIDPEVLNEYLKGGLGRWAIPMPEIAKKDPWWLDPTDSHRSTHTNMALFGHAHLLVTHGIHIIENLNLEELAAAKIYTFAFIGIPLKFRGATGSPIRPLALAG